MPPETPISYGMHPNAEINFLMSEQKDLFAHSYAGTGCRMRFLCGDCSPPVIR